MIIKVKFKDLETNEFFTMLFGDSYKTWKEQFREYMQIYKGKVVPVECSKSLSEWKGFGGLKWCNEDSFQDELNREDVQNGEPDNPNPRQYSEMYFKEMSVSNLPII